jgi:hypothetical protein
VYGYCGCGECLHGLVRLEGAVHIQVHTVATCTFRTFAFSLFLVVPDTFVEYVNNIK